MMKHRTLAENDYRIFTIRSLPVISLAWLGFLLALAGVFYFELMLLYLIGAGLVMAFFIFKKKIFTKLSRETLLVASALILIVIALSLFVTPTVFSGRDQGSISEAAVRLAENHQLQFSTPASQEFFKIYGPGRALNFPGFYYTSEGNLITQFPAAYIAWLAFWYAFFGLAGFIIANAILLFIFAFSFYLLARLFFPILPALLLLALVLVSFPIFWFFKFSLTEIMALALVWFAALQLVLFFRAPKITSFMAAVSTAGLLMFTRIEGFAIAVMLAVLLLACKHTRNFLAADIRRRVVLPLGLLAGILGLSLAVNFAFYHQIGAAFAKSLLAPSSEGISGRTNNYLLEQVHTLRVFSTYGLLPYLLFGIVGIIAAIKAKRNYIYLPFLLIAPTFFYLFDPYISQDHPWMLRRFAFTIVPALIFYTVYLLHRWYFQKKKLLIFYTASALLLIIGMPLFAFFGFFSENKGLFLQVKELGKNFSDNDLVLVDRLASGDGWAMISGTINYLYGKNAVYFFNPEDIEKIDTEKFDNIFLVSSLENVDFYTGSKIGSRLEKYKEYSLSANRLTNEDSAATLPAKQKVHTEGIIFKINK